jgi:hypothetical protein
VLDLVHPLTIDQIMCICAETRYQVLLFFSAANSSFIAPFQFSFPKASCKD